MQCSSQQDYTYDAEGQIQTWTRNYTNLNPVQRFDFGYDNADQLLTAPLKNASTNALIKQYSYGYDLAANRTSETVATATTTSVPNSVNEITSQSGGTVRTLTYDLNGSLTNGGKTSASATNASKVYTCEWDGANRLVAVNYTGTTNRSEFTYDGLSRVAKIVEKQGTTIKSTRKIVWCGNEMCEFRDATDAVTGRVYANGEFIGTTGYTFMRDHLGSVRELIKTDGNTLGIRLDYDPYGRQTTVSGNVAADFGFTGLYRHAASGLNFATYRAYDPDLGRWLNRDPSEEKGGVNLYGYVGGEPVGRIDPRGLTWQSNAIFFLSWTLGLGKNTRFYGPGSIESREMQNSIPGAILRRQFYEGGCQDFNTGTYLSEDAYVDTVFNPLTLDWTDTSAQVGGFAGASATNNGNGTVTFTVRNDAGAHSFFLHAVPNMPDHVSIPYVGAFTLPFRTIHQTISWTEPIR